MQARGTIISSIRRLEGRVEEGWILHLTSQWAGATWRRDGWRRGRVIILVRHIYMILREDLGEVRYLVR